MKHIIHPPLHHISSHRFQFLTIGIVSAIFTKIKKKKSKFPGLARWITLGWEVIFVSPNRSRLWVCKVLFPLHQYAFEKPGLRLNRLPNLGDVCVCVCARAYACVEDAKTRRLSFCVHWRNDYELLMTYGTKSTVPSMLWGNDERDWNDEAAGGPTKHPSEWCPR